MANLLETEAQVIEVVGLSITAVYDAIYPYYNQRTSDGIVLDVDWWLRHYPELERKRLMEAMSYRKQIRVPDSPKQTTRDEKAIQRAVRLHPERIVDAVNQLPEAERKAIKAEIREMVDPVLSELAGMADGFIPDEINRIAERLQYGHYDEEQLREIDEALDNLRLARTELQWRMEGERK